MPRKAAEGKVPEKDLGPELPFEKGLLRYARRSEP